MPRDRPWILSVAALLGALAMYFGVGAPHAAIGGGGVPELTDAQRAGSLHFAADVTPLDRQAVLDSIARARPEARRLIDVVDGAVTVEVGRAEGGNTGMTQPRVRDYLVVLDLSAVWPRHGARGAGRLILHELGHVVDFALVPPALEKALDAGIPPGYGCLNNGRAGGCSAREERFAESFAKWATNDIGVDLNLGYQVPPPSSLDAWGRRLARLR